MFRTTRFVAFVATMATSLTASAIAEAVSVQEKASLQAAMQRHIDSRTVDGAFLRLDEKTGAVRRLYPVSAHPKIMHRGAFFVLCFDFRNEAGEKVDLDFYVARNGAAYSVFHAVEANHGILMRFLKNDAAN
jgi:hypothetical protein